MLSKEEITIKLTEIIIQKLGVKPEDVKPAANFADDLKADSLDMVELVMAIEEEFSIDIPDSTLEDISIVSDAIDYISKHKD